LRALFVYAVVSAVVSALVGAVVGAIAIPTPTTWATAACAMLCLVIVVSLATWLAVRVHWLFFPWFSRAALDREMQTRFGDGTFASTYGRRGKHVMVPAFKVSGDPRVRLFSTATTPDVRVADAVAAACTVPTYFAPKTIDDDDYVDAVIVTKNPALLAYVFARNECQVCDDRVVLVSVGTGSAQLRISAARHGVLDWALRLLDVITHENNWHEPLERLNGAISYHRLQWTLPHDVHWHAVARTTVAWLATEGNSAVQSNARALRDAAECLLAVT